MHLQRCTAQPQVKSDNNFYHLKINSLFALQLICSKLKTKKEKRNDMHDIKKTYSLCLSLYSSAATAVAPVDASPAPRVFVAQVSSSVPALAAALLPAVPVVAYTHIRMKNKGTINSKWLQRAPKWLPRLYVEKFSRYLQVLLQLDFMLSREDFVFFLEFCK